MKPMLVIAPIMPHASDGSLIAKSLASLGLLYSFEILDPLSFVVEPIADYCTRFQAWFASRQHAYDGFIGFSFGGVLLQQCFPLMGSSKRPIFLFSTPSFIDNALASTLMRVLELCLSNRLQAALTVLYTAVFYPKRQVPAVFEIDDPVIASARLISGLQCILSIDSRDVLEQTDLDIIHFIGENSHLVTRQQVITPRRGVLYTVPDAGMRVLDDNLAYCKPIITNRLRACDRSKNTPYCGIAR